MRMGWGGSGGWWQPFRTQTRRTTHSGRSLRRPGRRSSLSVGSVIRVYCYRQPSLILLLSFIDRPSLSPSAVSPLAAFLFSVLCHSSSCSSFRLFVPVHRWFAQTVPDNPSVTVCVLFACPVCIRQCLV